MQKALILFFLMLFATPSVAGEEFTPEALQKTMEYLQRVKTMVPENVSPNLSLYTLADNIRLHRSYMDLGDQRLHANGLIVITGEGITVIDAPWSLDAAYDLLDWVDANFDIPLQRLVITHAHEDRMGGIDAFAERRIPIYSLKNTALLARQSGWTSPNMLFSSSFVLRSGDQAMEIYYPGPGHTSDNVVVWIPGSNILYAGCLSKSEYSAGLGFLGDADRKAWPETINRMMDRYPGTEMVIPGHGLPGGTALIERTLELLAR